MAGSVRQQRVAQAIFKNLSVILIREYGGTPLGGLVIQEVRVSPDLRNATVHYALMPGTPRRLAQDRLDEEMKRIRYLLAREIRHIKFMPELDFRFNERAEEENRLQELLDGLSREREARGDDSTQ